MSDQNYLITSAGVKMPRIIYGTAWKKERTADLVVQAIQAGFRGIDTACQPKHYDERLVGVALRRMQMRGIERAALYLQTKYTPLSSQDPERLPYDPAAPVAEQVAQSFETSTKNLQTDYVDCLILHSPLASHALTMAAWRAMEGIQKAGGARQLGISNCYDLNTMQALYADADVKPAVVQNRFNRKTGYAAAMRQWCAEHGVIFQSFWSLTANADLLGSEIVRTLAAQYGKTAAQIFFRFLSQSNIVPLTGTCSEQHMREDLALFDFELSVADLNGLTLLLKNNTLV